MKKNVFVFLLLFTTSFVVFGQKQLKVGDNSTLINSSAVLEIESSTKFFLPPRLTTAQLGNISNPATGLQVYCTDCSPAGLYSYNGTAWEVVGLLTGANLANGTILTGNGIGKAAAFPVSGDVTLSNVGVTTIGANTVTNAMLSGAFDLATKVAGSLPIVHGGTGATTAAAALTTLTTLGAQSTANLSADLTTDAASITKYPAVKTIIDYVEATLVSGAPDATTTATGKIQLAGTATAPTVTTAAVIGKTLIVCQWNRYCKCYARTC